VATKQRVNCSSCTKLFITTVAVTKVKCPSCGAVNHLDVGPEAKSAVPLVQSVPQYSFHEVSSVAKQLLDESVSLWIEVKVSEGSCHKKLYCLDKEKNEVYVTKATTTIDGTMDAILDVYWNWELEWDSSTVALIKILEDNGNNRLTLKEHKTTSAATLKNDVIVRSAYEQYSDHIWSYAVSEKSTIPERGGWRRAHLILSGFRIQRIEENRCEVTFIHSFDFGGWIHVKFIEEEQKKVALRLSRIKKKVEDDARILQQPIINTVVDVPYPVQSGVCKLCPTCNVVGYTSFCGEDGSKMILCCDKCFNPVTGSPFCGECGNKLDL